MLATKESVRETFRVDDEGLDGVFEQIKALIHEGNVRRIIVKDSSGATLIEAPLTVGMVGVMLLPLWASRPWRSSPMRPSSWSGVTKRRGDPRPRDPFGPPG